MAARNLVVENFDQLDDSALNELGNHYQHNECSAEEEVYEKEQLKNNRMTLNMKLTHFVQLLNQSSKFVFQVKI